MYDTTSSDDFNEQEFIQFLDDYQTKDHTVKCGTCKTTDTAPKRELELKGWMLFGNAAYCPSH